MYSVEKPKLIQNLGMLYPNPTSKTKTRYAIYECPFCGEHFKGTPKSIAKGFKASCGCYRPLSSKGKKFKHGLSRTKIHRRWCMMIARCESPNMGGYKNYGGRGITVCDEWKEDFMSFYNWAMTHGYASDLQIDRKDNDGNYSPENCRFVTRAENCQNKVSRTKVSWSGYKGISKRINRKGEERFSPYIRAFGVIHCLGTFIEIKEAIQAYNNFIIKNKWNHPLLLFKE